MIGLRRAKSKVDAALHDGVHPDDRAYYGGVPRTGLAEYIEEQHYRWNRLPPRRMRFCDRCGGEVRWYREGAVFDVETGAPSHRYHLKCRHFGDLAYERERMTEVPGANLGYGRLIGLRADMHYDSHLYATMPDDRDSFANDELP